LSSGRRRRSQGQAIPSYRSNLPADFPSASSIYAPTPLRLPVFLSVCSTVFLHVCLPFLPGVCPRAQLPVRGRSRPSSPPRSSSASSWTTSLRTCRRSCPRAPRPPRRHQARRPRRAPPPRRPRRSRRHREAPGPPRTLGPPAPAMRTRRRTAATGGGSGCPRRVAT
jgi:hypothetical protein